MRQSVVQRSGIFEKTLRNYLAEIARYDFTPHQAVLGVQCEGSRLTIPVFGKNYIVSADGIFPASLGSNGPAIGFAASVAICKYLLIGRTLAHVPAEEDWAAFKDFKDAAPLLGYFRNDVENAISAFFLGRRPELESAVLKLGGRPIRADLSYDLTMCLDVLPRVPVFLLFNDADAEFPAECRMLFERRAENYLDMESLAIVGVLTADYVKKAAQSSHQSF